MTPQPWPYIVTIGVFNEAGELVRTVAVENASAMMGTIDLISGGVNDPGVINTLNGLDISMPGVDTPSSIGAGGKVFHWDAKNDQGQYVRNGKYYIKIEMKDYYGHTNVVTKEIVTVMEDRFLEMRIYNRAGELVRVVRDDNPSTLTVSVDGVPDVIAFTAINPDVYLYYAAGLSMAWDGLTDRGSMITNGTYELQFVLNRGSGEVLEASKTIIVLTEAREEFLADIIIAPNPFNGEVRPFIEFSWPGSTGTGDLEISIWNLKGELVRKIHTRIEAGSINWDVNSTSGGSAASGVYVVKVKAINEAGQAQIKTVKLAILGKYTSDW